MFRFIVIFSLAHLGCCPLDAFFSADHDALIKISNFEISETALAELTFEIVNSKIMLLISFHNGV